MSDFVKQYLLDDLNDSEMNSYLSYIEGDKTSDEWINKSLIKRSTILNREPRCDHTEQGEKCNEFIQVWETGKCMCLKNHESYSSVLEIIHS